VPRYERTLDAEGAIVSYLDGDALLNKERIAHKRLLVAARRWWKTKRPRSYTLYQHMKNPDVNTTSAREAGLARAVAKSYR